MPYKPCAELLGRLVTTIMSHPGISRVSTSLKVLLITFNFPPDAEIGTRRVAAFCRYLPEFGVQPVVLTVEEHFYKVLDKTIPMPQGFRVVRTPLVNPLYYYQRIREHFRIKPKVLSGREKVQPAVRKSRGFRHQLLTLLNTPDQYLGWYLPAIKAAEKLIHNEPIDVVLSTGPPWTPHLIARHLKKKYHIPWLADFRDPWASDPWRYQVLPQWRQRIDRRLEASCVRWADLVLSATNSIRTQFAGQYPGSLAKFVTLTNGFDGSNVVKPRTTSQGSHRLFLHLGSLYGGRRIDTFCAALMDLTDEGLISAAETKVLFVGDNDPEIIAAAQQVAPKLLQNNCIEFRPSIPWKEARQFLDRADVLLIFQGEHRYSVPAKFYEYLQTGKPIFAIVEQGELSEMLETTGSGLWADPLDPKNIARKFVDVLHLPARPSEEVERLAKLYHFRSLTQTLVDWIRFLL